MKHLVPKVLRVERNVVQRIKRILHGKGELFIQKNQEVTPDMILGTSTVSAGFRILNLATELKVKTQEAEKFLIKKIGQRIYKGELLASKKRGFLSTEKMLISPSDGILDFFNKETGEARISFIPKKEELPAGVYGVVEDVDIQRGRVIIRTVVDKVFGLFGSGGIRSGVLQIVGSYEELVSKMQINHKHYGYILVGGSAFPKDAISASISAGATGIITGGIEAVDYRGMAGGRISFPRKLDNDIGISIMVTEGFGSVPIAADIYGILSEYEGKFAFIDGNKAVVYLPIPTSECMTKVKGTVLPPEEKDYSREIFEITLGCKVRVVGHSYLGEQGKLLKIDNVPTLLPSGLKCFLATIETNRRKLQVPVANLEAIV